MPESLDLHGSVSTELKSADELKTYTQKIKDEMKAVEEKKKKDQLDSNFRECVETIKNAANLGEFSVCFGKELSQADKNALKEKNYKVEYYEYDCSYIYRGWGYEISWR